MKNIKILIGIEILFILIVWLCIPSGLLQGCIVLSHLLFIFWVSQPFHTRTIPTNAQGRSAERRRCHDRYSQEKVNKDIEQQGDYDIVIIGSGMSGLTTASILSRMGNRVLVLEQHPTTAGGGTHSFELGSGYKFDSGLHYTIKWSGPLVDFATGRQPGQPGAMKLRRMGGDSGVFDRIKIGDEPVFDIKHGEAHLQQLLDLFPQEKSQLEQYLQLSTRINNKVPLFVISKLLPKGWLRSTFEWVFLSEFYKYAALNHEQVLTDMGMSPRLRAYLSSLWIDTGSRPDRCTFWLMSAVQRGLPLEGACYPDGGAEAMSKALVKSIEENAGRVLIRARVDKINVLDNHPIASSVDVHINNNNGYASNNDSDNDLSSSDFDSSSSDSSSSSNSLSSSSSSSSSSKLLSKKTIFANKAIVSSVGYYNLLKLLDPALVERLKFIHQLPGTPPSLSFVMVNLGFNQSAETLGVDNANLWIHPSNKQGDIMAELHKFWENPLDTDMPAMITWPSVKNAAWKDTEKSTVQVLILVEYSWFKQFQHPDPEAPARRINVEAYQALKQRWIDKASQMILQYYPKIKPHHIDYKDCSTPLTIHEWLSSESGAAVGLCPSPARFTDPVVQDALEIKNTKIQRLYLTGQDTLLMGIPMVQISGVLTAFKIAGFWNSTKYILRSIFSSEQQQQSTTKID